MLIEFRRLNHFFGNIVQKQQICDYIYKKTLHKVKQTLLK